MKTDKDKKPQLFKPGQSGNPSGRPKGSRNKLQESFLKDCYEAWQTRGKEVIERTIDEKPADFLKVVAAIVPKDVNVTLETTFVDYLKAINDVKPASTGQSDSLEREPESVRH